MSFEKKQRDLEFGKFAEAMAREWYIAHGYAIKETNWRLNKIEIDLIVQQGATMVFVEVKARSGRDMDALDAVTADKIKRIARGANAYLCMQELEYDYRFDIVTLTGDFTAYELEVYEDAFLSPLISR